ncbi:xanthine dehydrogenase family protein molybdopterin-binding subunit [Amycolatopsis nigrescens]|uniref:xanthine dehydrogenase family protein molybdopterin-binding subunit n=1 Tax=Amycolatopsis nigrescens TaxID=381445 RepID=UPI000361B91B|nr:xanthine dehydrogenase family protein molybdopterin-binding subunit [Amycolatopsis nigrescens]
MNAGLRRPDGPAKLTGAARYTADQPVPDALVAALVGATVPTGRLTGLDVERAAAAPGVVRVLGRADLPPLTEVSAPPAGHVLPMRDDLVHHEGQAVAIVLAQTAEQARYAAGLVEATYAEVTPPLLFGQAEDVVPVGGNVLGEPDERKGDPEDGLAVADVVVSETYGTADRHHSPIEPAATTAWWEGGELVVHASVQAAGLTQQALAVVFGLRPEQVRVHCRYIGGGFGSKGYLWPQVVLAAAAAKAVERPVKLVLTRAEMFTMAGHQPATRQVVTLGATADGDLTAIRHHSSNASARAVDYAEATTHTSTWLYRSPAIETAFRIQRVDRPGPTPMRAPHEGPGMFALESAMDELAYGLGMDPVELRLRNEPEVDPLTGRPFSSRKLVECLREGADRFGWADRPAATGALRDGDDLVGWGMAVASMDTFRSPSAVRLRVDADGHVVIESSVQEIGTGLPAMVRAAAAEVLGCAPDDVDLSHGDTGLPPHGGTIGSMSTMGLGSAVQAAAADVLAKLGAEPGGGRPLADLMAEAGLDELTAEGRWAPEASALVGGRSAEYSMHTYGSIFVEVRVDAELGLVRMSRAVGTYGAGRILNPLAARSQMIGGITWGYGQAVLEESVFEPDLGRFLSKNLAGYVVPVNADIGEIDVSFVDDEDRLASAIGAKGIGELGAVGVSAAVANAVFHATGRRVRNLPIKIPDLL